jgi:hypothetical protein
MTDPGDRLRDQFFAGWPDAPRPPLAPLDAPPITTLQGLSLSYFPTIRFRQLRFLVAADLDDTIRPRFARPCPALPELAAVFVDPAELSYRSFENIIGLDHLFTDLGAAPIHLTDVHKLAADVTQLRFQTSNPLRARLAQLDELGLYIPPFDSSRGGHRFIFHSAGLAAALTRAVREALPKRLLRGFVHVNPVFRCNRFEPGDAPFAAHVDSPYYDRARHHVSKYTLLLYLTPGRGDAPLRFTPGPDIHHIEADTAFVFAQHLAHEGRPYVDGRKVFLRTELVYEDPTITHAPGVAELFAKACYLGSNSTHTPELAAHAHVAYDRAAAAHWHIALDPPRDEPYVHKQFRGAHFVTNGHDYWFRRDAHPLHDCAALALLDLLNAAIAGHPFHKLCHQQVLLRSPVDRAWISELLRAQPLAPEPVFARLHKPALFPEPERPLTAMDFPRSPDFDDEPYPDDWDATRNPRVIAVYTRARRWAMRRILPAPITMLGQELFLDPAQFVVVADKIHILSRERLAPVHFAGARFFGEDDFVGVDVTLRALQPLVPPMSFRTEGDTLHLRCDLFRNSWQVAHRIDDVPIPRIHDDRDVDPDDSPWLIAAKLTLAQLTAQTRDD